MFSKKCIGIYTHDFNLLKLRQALYQWLLPFTCLLCCLPTKKFSNICSHCEKDLPILPQCCVQCAKFLHIAAEIKDLSLRAVCGDCLSRVQPFDQTYALFPYGPPIVQLIIQLKFQGKLHVAQSLGELFSHKIKTVWYKEKRFPDLIIPVPLHEKRLRERGFNQALEIARPIARSLKIPIDFSHTVRTKQTRPQSSLTKKEREENLKNAFKVLKNYTGLYIAVIDDVITTGQTITTFCQLLKDNGASQIDVWCAARRG